MKEPIKNKNKKVLNETKLCLKEEVLSKRKNQSLNFTTRERVVRHHEDVQDHTCLLNFGCKFSMVFL